MAVPVASIEARNASPPWRTRSSAWQTPPFFSAVGQWYERIDQTEDKEVRELLARSRVTFAADSET